MQEAPAPAPQSRQEQRWPAAEEQREPIPLESLTPLPVVNTGRELEKACIGILCFREIWMRCRMPCARRPVQVTNPFRQMSGSIDS